jgi:hypothetical protein
VSLGAWTAIEDWYMTLGDSLADLLSRGVFAVDAAGVGTVTKTAGSPLVITGAHDGANRASIKSQLVAPYDQFLIMLRYRVTAGTNQPLIYASDSGRYMCTFVGLQGSEELRSGTFSAGLRGDTVPVVAGRTCATVINCRAAPNGGQQHWAPVLDTDVYRTSWSWGSEATNEPGGDAGRVWFLGGYAQSTAQWEIDAFQIFGR